MRSKTKKLIWAVPLMAVVAAIGALAIFMAQSPNEASAQVTSGTELPGMVQKLTVAPNAQGTPEEELLLSWEAPKDGGYVTSYRIDVSDDGKRWVSHIADHGASDLSLVYNDLKAESTKHFRVFAWNQHGTGPGTDKSGTTAVSDKPDRATGLTATNGSSAFTYMFDLNKDGDAADTDVDKVKETDFNYDFCGDNGSTTPDGKIDDVCDNLDETATRAGVLQTDIKLEWTAPEDPAGAPVTGYRIEYSPNGTQWHLLVDNTSAYNVYAHRGLPANTESMQYRVYAINRYGMSSVSDAAAGSTAASTAPGEIGDLTIGLSPASTDLHLKWVKPTDPPGDPVTHYRIQARIGTSTTASDYKNLHAGKHIVRTTVYNPGGDDLKRAGITVPTNIADGGLVVDIRIAAINRVNTNALDTASGVTWVSLDDVPVGDPDAPRRAGTPTVKQDQEQHQGRSGLNVTWPTGSFIEGQGPDTTNFGAQVEYILVINGTEQTGVDHTTALTLGGSTTKPGADDNALATETERKYVLYVRNTNNTGANGVADVTATSSGAGSAPTVSIRSFPSREVSGSTARPTLPRQPGSFSVSSDGHTEIKLSWSAPNTDDECPADDSQSNPPTGTGLENTGDGSECGASVLDGYKIEVSETGTSGWKTVEAMHSKTSYTADMLDPGKRYYFRVSAVNSRGVGNATPAESDETHDAGEPTPPGGLVAQAMGHTAIKLCWFEQNLVDPLTGNAILDEGLPVLGYRITYMDGKTEKVLVENTNSKDTQYTDMMGLTAGESRTYRVYSISLGGVGTSYTTATGSTMDANLPGAPTGVTAKADSDTAITVSWTAPTDNGGAAITGYKVMWKMSSADAYVADDMATAAADATSHQVTGLTASTAYTFKVMATNAKGDSMASAEVTETTDLPNDGQLGAPTGVTATSTTAQQLDLTWEGGENADSYRLIAVDVDEYEATGTLVYESATVSDGAARSGEVSDLTPGTTYLGVVIAVKGTGADMELMFGFAPAGVVSK